MERDLNPRYGRPYAGFQNRCLKPLGHPSVLGFLGANRGRGKPRSAADKFFEGISGLTDHESLSKPEMSSWNCLGRPQVYQKRASRQAYSLSPITASTSRERAVVEVQILRFVPSKSQRQSHRGRLK